MKIDDLNITITKSKRKTVSIFVERDGSVSAIVPEDIEDEKLEKVLQSKTYQIHKNLTEWKELNDRHVEREYVSGQSFMYLGRNYRLKLTEEKSNQLIFKNNTFFLSKDEVENAENFFVEFYRQKLEKKLKQVVPVYEKRLGVKTQKIKVMELQNRWASCTNQGNINFHWKCAMAPMDVLHYIVAHELSHLIHMNHNPEFWNELDKVLPNYAESMKWLKYNGAGMSL